MQVIQHFLKNSLRNYNYIVISDVNDKAIFFDPYDIDQTLPICKSHGGDPQFLINTHFHPDHDKDNQKYLDQTGSKIINLNDGESFQLSESESIQCLFTPGHVMDHNCFLLTTNGVTDSIICGDTIFNAGMGHCRLGGDVEVLYETFKNIISKLPDDLKIYPSHDYFLNNLQFSLSVEPDNEDTKKYIAKREVQNLDEEFMNTTIGEERLFNPFFRVFNEDFKSKFNMNEKELFIHLRSLRDKW